MVGCVELAGLSLLRALAFLPVRVLANEGLQQPSR